jgi:hypothetical protein
VQHAQDPILAAVGEGRVGHVQPRNLRCEREHVAGLNAVHDLRDPLRRHDQTPLPIQPTLHRADLREHRVVAQGRVASAVLGHEPERARVLGAAELRAEIPDQPARGPVADPLAEVVQA